MTGSGTQEVPYIITTADDLYQIDTLGGKEVYFRLGADIDFNGTPYAENFVSIPLKCKELDGNGFAIRNPYCNILETGKRPSIFTAYSTSNSGSPMILKNLTVENAYVQGDKPCFINDYNGSGTMSVQNCRISCTFRPNSELSNSSSSKGSLMSNYGAKTTDYDLCTLVIKADLLKPYPLITSGSIKRTQISLDLSYTAGRTHELAEGNRNSLFYKTSISDSYIFGKISTQDSSETINGAFSFAYDGKHDNFYQIIEYSGIQTVYWDTVFGGVCFYNKDITGEITVTDTYSSSETYSELMYGLTTEQCKDADYLKELGYLCEGSE